METEQFTWQLQSTSLPFETMRTIEHAAFAAWPALQRADVDGWRLRAAQGITGRANSVWALEDGGVLSLDEKLAAVESFYHAQALPSRFQIQAAVQPSGLDDELEARGYRLVSPTHVQVAPLARILEQTPTLRTMPHVAVEVAEEFDEGWFEAYSANEEMDTHTAGVRKQILCAIEGPRAFARLDIDDQPAAVGLGVVSGGWLGLFCMSTHPQFRRRGAASSLVRTLAIWGSLYDATTAYLQVSHGNNAALATYARVGFTHAYAYHYRVKEPVHG